MLKTKSLSQHIKSYLNKCINFGPRWAISNLIGSVTFALSNGKKGANIVQKSNANYLERNYSHLYDKYMNFAPVKHIPNDAPLFVFWYQGAESMPRVVRACYESILRNCAEHPVHLIDKNNIHNYADIPGFFYDKMNKGIFPIQGLADILRCSLLSEGGGIWCDATIYLSTPPLCL